MWVLWEKLYNSWISEETHQNCSVSQKCDSCGKLFTRAHNLRGHIKSIHEGHKDFECESCGKLFTRAYNMRKHIKTVHEGHLTLVN